MVIRGFYTGWPLLNHEILTRMLINVIQVWMLKTRLIFEHRAGPIKPIITIGYRNLIDIKATNTIGIV